MPDSSSNYSMHKNFAERLCKELYPKLTILRVGGLVGEALKKNAAYDIKHKRQLFINPASEINFISTKEVANIVHHFLYSSKHKVYNIAATDSIRVSDIIALAKLNEYYNQFDLQDLPTQKYNIDTQRLQKEYSCKTSKEYINEYLEM